MAFSSAASYRTPAHLPSSADSRSLLPLKVDKITLPCDLNPKPHSIFCTLAKHQPMAMTEQQLEPVVMQRPDSFGRFGMFGGKYVPETLMYALTELETAFKSLASDLEFQVLLKEFFFFFFLPNEYLIHILFFCISIRDLLIDEDSRLLTFFINFNWKNQFCVENTLCQAPCMVI